MQRKQLYTKPFLFFITLLLFISSFTVSALDPSKAVTQHIIDRWTDDEGLPQISVHAILQTGDGYLWVGTEEGLARFDGMNFTVFDDSNTPQMNNPYIHCLYEDSQGNLWIGTLGGGLLLYQNGRFQRFSKEEGLTSPVVISIAETKDGNLWVGTDPGGLFRFSPGDKKFKNYTMKDGLSGNVILGLRQDSKGNLWIGTMEGLSRFRDNRFFNYMVGEDRGKGKNKKKPLESDGVTVIFEDSKNNLWIGARGGLYRMENGSENSSFKKYNVKGDHSAVDISAIYEDVDQNLWLGTKSSGLIRYSNGSFSRLDKSAGLAGSWIIAVTGDREGNVWVGTSYGGLQRLKDEKFTSFTTREGLSDNVVFSVYQDSKEYIWFGTNNGLNRYKDGKFKHLTSKNGLTNNAVDTIAEDSSGAIWVGTDSGLNQLKDAEANRFNQKSYFKSLKDKFIPSIMESKNGDLWIGTLQGAVRYNGKKVDLFTSKEGLATRFVNFIHEDREGNLWFCTMRGGVTQFRNGKFIIYNKEHGLASNTINCIYEDIDGILWFGSSEGLTRCKAGKFSAIRKKQGLYNNNIYQILEENGNLWMSTNKGIFKVSKKELHAAADGKLARVKSTAYGKDDGMISSECNGGYKSAGFKTKDGRLWFPTTKGVVVIDPGNIKTNKVLIPVYVEQVLLDGKPASTNREVTIRPGIKRLEIHYTAPSFVNAQKVFFKYKLEGYDEQWLDAGTRRTAYYTNLDGGTYNFKVAACNNDGLWNNEGIAIGIEVIPPIWETRWFMVIALVIFGFCSYVVINFFHRYVNLTRFWKKSQYIGPFKIIDKIGSGGMGNIYKAHNQMDKTETVALKVLRDDLITDENNRKRFKQEAAIIDQLHHPHIVKVFERGQSGDNMFIAMELLEGGTLTDKISESGKMGLLESSHIMLQVADALAKIHHRDIIHRDLKPDNIMLIERGSDPNFVKLLDFGLARMQNQTRLTQTGMVIGTINYMSPEQISGQGAVAASDVYALGIIFYEMLTGEKPFVGETTIDIMKQILDKSPIEPIRFRFDISFELNHLIMRMLQKEKEKRPAVDEILAQLRITDKDISSVSGPVAGGK